MNNISNEDINLVINARKKSLKMFSEREHDIFMMANRTFSILKNLGFRPASITENPRSLYCSYIYWFNLIERRIHLERIFRKNDLEFPERYKSVIFWYRDRIDEIIHGMVQSGLIKIVKVNKFSKYFVELETDGDFVMYCSYKLIENLRIDRIESKSATPKYSYILTGI